MSVAGADAIGEAATLRAARRTVEKRVVKIMMSVRDEGSKKCYDVYLREGMASWMEMRGKRERWNLKSSGG